MSQQNHDSAVNMVVMDALMAVVVQSKRGGSREAPWNGGIVVRR